MGCPNCFADAWDDNYCSYCHYRAGELRDVIFLPLGSVLQDGAYIIGRVLGRPGGFGITYLAMDTRLDMKVAIKEFLPLQTAGRAADGKSISVHTTEYVEDFNFGLDKFLDEAKLLAHFRHPNIVRVLNFFRENNTAYMVMDFLEGQSLAEYLSRLGRITGPDAVELLLPVLDGLAHIHARNFIHRDVKPSNIYLTEEGKAILLDFGTARQAIGQRSQNLTSVVTQGFAPWEQYHRKGKQGPWTDVYACAATLYFMITGQLPPDGAERAIDDDITPLEVLVPGIDPGLASAIMIGLALKPEDRPQTAGEFQALLLGEQSQAKPARAASTFLQPASKIPEAAIISPGPGRGSFPPSLPPSLPPNLPPSVPSGFGQPMVAPGISAIYQPEPKKSSAMKWVWGTVAVVAALAIGLSIYLNGNMTTSSSDGTYTGQVKWGKRHGMGTLVLSDGSRFTTNWVDGYPSGAGELLLPTGEKMTGVFDSVNKTANITLADGSKYDGGFVNGRFNGHGTMLRPTGARYEGDFRDGKKQGSGVLTMPDGAKAEGIYENDLMNGAFKITKKDGETILGTFRADQQEGEFRRIPVKEELFYVSTWRNGKQIGKEEAASPLSIKGVRIKNTDKSNAVLNDWNTRFAKAQVRFIHFEATLVSEFTRPINGTILVKYVNPNGTIRRNVSTSPAAGTLDKEFEIATNGTKTVSHGWGNADTGVYEYGTTRIEFWWQGFKIGETSFEVY